MAERTKDIQSKRATVGNLKKITKAMEMVARSKMKRAVERALSTRPYTEAALAVLRDISNSGESGVESGEDTNTHSLLIERKEGKTLLVVVAANRGLCGGYNAGIERKLRYMVGERKNTYFEAITVGRYAEKSAKKFNIPLVAHFDSEQDKPAAKDIEPISAAVREAFLTGDYRHVEFVYTNFKTMFNQEVVALEIVPLTSHNVSNILTSVSEDTIRAKTGEEHVREKEAGEEPADAMLFEPSKQDILETFLPKLLTILLFQGVLEAKASEESARAMAMKSATDNADALGESLRLRYNRARQAGITQEILEIASGAEAVSA